MLSLSTSKRDSDINQQSSNRNRQPTKIRHSIKEVVLHHPKMSPPMEDWILFPDEVIKCKNSSVRNPHNQTASKSSFRPDKSLEGLSSSTQTASTTTKKSSSQSLIAHASQDLSRSLRASDKPDSIKKSFDIATKDIGGKPPKVKAPRRLPTPDLSEVEEDDFWSCCGSAASSRSG